MDLVIRIIEHLLNEAFSIDRIDSILGQLNISKGQLFEVIDNEQYQDFFQILRPSNNHKQGSEKLALTLDVSRNEKEKKKPLEFSFSVVHITLIIVRMPHVHSSIFAHTILGQCVRNVRIRIARTIMMY